VIEDLALLERIVVRGVEDAVRAAQHALEHQRVVHGVRVEEVEREERVAQVVEHAHEQHEVEALAEGGDVVHRELPELDVEAGDLAGEARLREVALVRVDPHDPGGAAALHLEREEPGVAPDVEDGLPIEALRQGARDGAPHDVGVIAEEVLRGGLHPVEVEVVKPLAELVDPPLDVLA
jgi:hypothetical protein